MRKDNDDNDTKSHKQS